MQLIENVLKQNKTAIVLVPEISLTPQMIDRFLARFGNTIAVLHSKLSTGERYDQWKNIKEGVSKIVIGARSAIFAPIKNLGIIIIDEEHDLSYKSEMSPRFNAKEIASYMAKQNDIPLVLRKCNAFYKHICKSKERKNKINKTYKKSKSIFTSKSENSRLKTRTS